MTTKQIKQRLTLATAALLLASVAALAWAVLVPAKVTGSAQAIAGPVGSNGGTTDEGNALPALAKLTALGRIDLRRPLKDPPAQIPPPPKPLQAKLLGIIFETERPEQSMAMFKLANGSEQWLKAGQSFEDPVGQVRVVEVGEQKVKLFYRERESELTVSTP